MNETKRKGLQKVNGQKKYQAEKSNGLTKYMQGHYGWAILKVNLYNKIYQ